MPFKVGGGGHARVNPRDLDGNNRGAFETVRRKDKNDPTKHESHYRARFRDRIISASSSKSKASSTKPKVPFTESSMTSVEIQQLVVAIYFASRRFGFAMIQELIQQRVGEAPDPDIDQKVAIIMKDAKLCEEGIVYCDRVDEWLNKQMSQKELVELTKVDDYIQQSMDQFVGA